LLVKIRGLLIKKSRSFCSLTFALLHEEFIGVDFKQHNKKRKKHWAEYQSNKAKHADAGYYAEYRNQWMYIT
jgi:hypothetical protein